MRRFFVGLFLVLHGLAHAVFPVRGFGAIEPALGARLIMGAAWMVALLGFCAAGFGRMGARPWSRFWRRSAAVALAGSAVALIGAHQLDLWWGVAIDAAIAAALIATSRRERHVRPVLRRRSRLGRLGDVVAAGFLAYFAVAALGRPWMHRWGIRQEELAMPLPGDWPNRTPAVEVNHAVSVAAPPERIWPYLIQVGRDRGGFYSYSWLENLFGLHIHNADRPNPAWQSRAVGELVPATPPRWLGLPIEPQGWKVAQVVPDRALVLENWGAFVLVPQRDGSTRFIVRSKFGDPRAPVWGAVLTFVTLDVPHFIMERKMLLTLRDLAERDARAQPRNPVGMR